MPDDVTSACGVYAPARELPEVFRPEDEGDGNDDDCEPVKSPAQGIVLGWRLDIHEVASALPISRQRAALS